MEDPSIIETSLIDSNILAALIGVAGAILGGAIIFLNSRREDRKKDKRAIIAEIIGISILQLKLMTRLVASLIWYEYHTKIKDLAMIKNIPDLINRVESGIESSLVRLESLESKLMENDGNLAKLSAKFNSFYPKNIVVKNLITEITRYNIDNNINLKRFDDWTEKDFNADNVVARINSFVKESHKILNETFKNEVDSLNEILEENLTPVYWMQFRKRYLRNRGK